MSRTDDTNKISETTENAPEFSIQRLYVKDISFEAPNSPAIFLEEWKPQMDLKLDNQASKLDEATRELVLTVTVTVKIKDQIAFLAEVKQAGIFNMKGFTEEQLQPMLGAFCPNILYPYAREAITDLVTRGGLPQLYLSPINFDALFQEHTQKGTEGGTIQ